MEKRVFWMKVDPIRGSQASIKPFFDGLSTMSKIAPSEGVSSKPKVHHSKVVNEALKIRVCRDSNRPTTHFFILRQHCIEVTYAESNGIKIVTKSNERVPKGLPISSVWGAIDT
jgi:hypothetical protein